MFSGISDTGKVFQTNSGVQAFCKRNQILADAVVDVRYDTLLAVIEFLDCVVLPHRLEFLSAFGEYPADMPDSRRFPENYRTVRGRGRYRDVLPPIDTNPAA